MEFKRTYYIEVNYTNNYSERFLIRTYQGDRKLSLKEAINKSKSIFKNAKNTNIYKKINVKLYNEYNQLIFTTNK